MPVIKQNEHHMDMPHFAKRILWTLIGILLVYMIVFFGTLIRNNMQKYLFIGHADRQERMVSVEGQGKVVATPDVAMITMGVIAEGKTVAEAQGKNTAIMNTLNDRLRALGVETKDIRTANYTVYPQYNYTQDKGQQMIGYQINQQVTVKIRDLNNASRVLALAGEVGANNVGGLTFTVDDPETYRAQARRMALQKVSEKARILSQSLGVRFGSVVSYNEYEGNTDGSMYRSFAAEGMGGVPAAAPRVEAGSADMIMNVQVTFDIQ